MTLTIPNEIFDSYYEAMDAFIENENIGVAITLYYPAAPTPIDDPSHSINSVRGSKTNYGEFGDLEPYSQFGGSQIKMVEPTETIRVRWYPDPKYWTKICTVTNPDVVVLMIGYMSQIDKVRRATQIGDDIAGMSKRYCLAGDPQKWGFGDRYFVAKLKQA